MKKLWKTFSSAYPVRVLTATSASVFQLLIFNYKKDAFMIKRTHQLLSVALMVAMAFAGDRLLSELFQYINLESHFRFSRVYNATGQSEILLVGNSRGHTFYQPKIQEITHAATLNLSYNALPTSIARALVEDYYDLYAAPEKMVIEVSMLAKTEEQVINEFKLYVHQSERIKKVVAKNSPRTVAAISISNLYSFNTEAFQRSLYYLRKNDEDWILDKKINAGMIANQHTIPVMHYEITKDRLSDFMAIVNLARRKNTEVRLVLAPFYPAFHQKIINLKQFVSKIEMATGLKVYNYAGLINDDQYFSDYMHLNKQGSIKFIEQMRRDEVL